MCMCMCENVHRFGFFLLPEEDIRSLFSDISIDVTPTDLPCFVYEVRTNSRF